MKKLSVSQIAALTGHSGSIYTLLADPENDNLFYSGSGDGTIVRWDLSNFEQATVVAKVSTNIFSLNIIAARNLLLLGQMQGGIHVIDMEQKKEIKHLAYHKKGVFDIKLMNGDRFLAAGGDGVLSLWSFAGFSLVREIPVSHQSIRGVAFHPDNSILALGCSDNHLYILDTGTFELIKKISFHDNSVFSVCFSPDGKKLLAGSRDAYLSFWDVENGFQEIKSVPAHMFTINSIAYNHQGDLFATASRDKTVKIWDAESLELLKVIDNTKLGGHVNSVNDLIWSGKNDQLITCSDDRSIMVWDIC